MPGLPYWIARFGLVVAWLAVAALAWRRGQRPVAIAALLYASARAVPWNYELLELGRAGLGALGAYDQRIYPKIVLGVVVAGSLAVLLLRRARPAAGGDRSPWLLFVAVLMQGLLLMVETFSLDDLLPRPLTVQPGRYLYEGAMATLALGGLRSGRGEFR